jgi:PncC family amidohydrolase
MTGSDVERILEVCKERGLTVAVAESCTGGLVGHLLTNAPGASAVFMGGVIAYDNEVKIKLLGVEAETIRKYGAVSKETAEEMAVGVRKALGTDAGLAITGIAGPGGGTVEKPVGTVFVAAATKNGVTVERLGLSGGREEIKMSAAKDAIRMLIGAVSPG